MRGGDKAGDDRFYDWFVPKADKLWELYDAKNQALWPKKKTKKKKK